MNYIQIIPPRLHKTFLVIEQRNLLEVNQVSKECP